ncbi:MAG: hypothetical protein WBB74_01490, partial [Gaiellaceae bacterium]
TLDRANAIWTLTSTGSMRNPNPNGGNVTKTLTAKVTVVPTVTQPLNTPAWNYIYSTHTGSACDQTLNNNVGGSSRMYIMGNLCIGNNAGVTSSSLMVQGNLDLSNNTSVGVSTNMGTRVETYVGGNCRYGSNNPPWVVCTGNQDSRHIYSKLSDGATVGVNHTVPVIAAPAADFNTWYQNAIPGPAQSCTYTSGTVPVFDNNYPTNDLATGGSVPTIFDLTPSSSYECRVGPSGSPSGLLKWDASTKTLTVSGTIYIDGSAKIGNGALNQYNGQATLYLAGTFYLSGKLCGGVSGSNCDFPSWNPNTEMFTIVAHGTGGQVNPGDSIQVANNGSFQGGLFGTGNVDYGNNAYSDGPIVGSQIIISNNVTTNAFATITTVPVGQPGNPEVYAQPNPPQNFSG